MLNHRGNITIPLRHYLRNPEWLEVDIQPVFSLIARYPKVNCHFRVDEEMSIMLKEQIAQLNSLLRSISDVSDTI
jgi:hypothetical protein